MGAGRRGAGRESQSLKSMFVPFLLITELYEPLPSTRGFPKKPGAHLGEAWSVGRRWLQHSVPWAPQTLPHSGGIADEFSASWDAINLHV